MSDSVAGEVEAMLSAMGDETNLAMGGGGAGEAEANPVVKRRVKGEKKVPSVKRPPPPPPPPADDDAEEIEPDDVEALIGLVEKWLHEANRETGAIQRFKGTLGERIKRALTADTDISARIEMGVIFDERKEAKKEREVKRNAAKKAGTYVPKRGGRKPAAPAAPALEQKVAELAQRVEQLAVKVGGSVAEESDDDSLPDVVGE